MCAARLARCRSRCKPCYVELPPRRHQPPLPDALLLCSLQVYAGLVLGILIGLLMPVF